MTIFAGIKGYKWAQREKIPAEIYWNWLREKWRADLKTVAWCIVMSPFLLIWLFGAAVVTVGMLIAGIGEAILRTKKILPRFMFLPADIRKAQLGYADASRKYVADRQEDIMRQLRATCKHEHRYANVQATCCICKMTQEEIDTAAAANSCQDEGCPHYGTPHGHTGAPDSDGGAGTAAQKETPAGEAGVLSNVG